MTLHNFLLQQNFVRSDYESYFYVCKNPSTGEETMIAVCVGNLVIISSSDPSIVRDLKLSFASRFEITDLGSLTQILGIKVVRDRRNKCFFLCQASFVKGTTIAKFGLDFLPAVCTTPMDHTVDLSPSPRYVCALQDANRYRSSMVGTLAWLSNWTRPELAFAVHKLQRSQSNPEPEHFEAAERVFSLSQGHSV
ncbi:unnamed protein product [Heterosigma akashiwo]